MSLYDSCESYTLKENCYGCGLPLRCGICPRCDIGDSEPARSESVSERNRVIFERWDAQAKECLRRSEEIWHGRTPGREPLIRRYRRRG